MPSGGIHQSDDAKMTMLIIPLGKGMFSPMDRMKNEFDEDMFFAATSKSDISGSIPTYLLGIPAYCWVNFPSPQPISRTIFPESSHALFR
jgi:hypothetical protein